MSIYSKFVTSQTASFSRADINTTNLSFKQHENVAVIFSDLCGFTKISGSLEPLQVVELLTCLWQKFDGLTNNLGNVTKVCLACMVDAF